MKGKFEKATNENHIKSQLKMDMRPPGFEPGLEAREAVIIEKEELRNFVDRFLSRYKKKDTKRGYRNVLYKYLDEIGKLDKDSVLEFKHKYEFEPYGEILFRRFKTFLNWLTDETGYKYNEWNKLLKWRGEIKEEYYVEEEAEELETRIKKAIELTLNRKTDFGKNQNQGIIRKIQSINGYNFRKLHRIKTI